MRWFVVVFLVITVSYHPKSEPSKRNELAEPIENIVIKLDTISNKLDSISQKIEQFMRIIIMAMVCALLTGCGLFKKSKKIDKTLTSIEVSKDVKVSTDTKKEQVDRSITDVKSSVQSDESTKVYPTKGTEVKINPDGSMTFHADSIIQKPRRNSNEAKNIANDIKNTLD